jgi:hypothetical protein
MECKNMLPQESHNEYNMGLFDYAIKNFTQYLLNSSISSYTFYP